MACAASRWALINRLDKSVGTAARPAQGLGATNLACDNGISVNLYGLAGDGGGNMQSSATRFFFFSPMPLLLASGTMGIVMAIAPLWVKRQKWMTQSSRKHCVSQW